MATRIETIEVTGKNVQELLSKLARDAVHIQGDSNPLGVSKSFAHATQQLWEILQFQDTPENLTGYDQLRAHPIFRLWVSKMHELAGMGLGDMDLYEEAHNACLKIADAAQTVAA
jgi:hypothetical protein